MLNVKVIKGKLPTKENEIAIEERMYNLLEQKPQLGEKIKLNYFYTDSTGKRLGKKDGEFIFCGILEDFEDSKLFQTGNAYVTLETAKSLTANLQRVYQQWFTIKSSS